MTFELINLIISILMLIGLGIYAYFTYLIAKDTQEIFVSFTLQQTINQPNHPKVNHSHISFGAVNRTKFEIEVFSKILAKINNQNFEFKRGFYADDTNMLIQPFMSGEGGFDLKDLENDEGVKLEDFIKKNHTNSIKFRLQIKYRKVGTKKWKKTSPQQYHYNFKTHEFLWDV
ncbi:MAG: hypothetical protein Q8Q35_03905 [Nanoarchaeota archaeon]|nr:hypothetical protein [Nanoarchaeota archaeon]